MRFSGKVTSRWLVAMASVSLGSAAVAQPAGRMSTLEEVIVTAQKRSESLQEAPISLAVFGEAALENSGFTDLGDLQSSVPNLAMREMPSSKSAMRAFIRGVGNNDSQITQDPAVAVYLDGAYIGRSTGLITELSDVERIEVLRGPQGTLYGRNATGGAINIISKQPSGQFGLRQEVTLGNRNLWRNQTTVDLPEVAGFSTKLSYIKGAVDGWVKNRAAGADFNELDKEAFRLAVRWTPTDSVTLDYSYDLADMQFGSHHEQSLRPPRAAFAITPYSEDRLESASPFMPFRTSDLDIEGHSLTVDVTLTETLSAKSITAYREMDESLYQDYAPNPFIPWMFANEPFETTQHQFSQELQLIGAPADGTINYVAGLYYFTEGAKEVATDYIFGNLLQSRRTKANNDAWAGYGQVSWRPPILDDALELTLGVRYSEDEREVDGSRIAALDGVVFNNVKGDDDWNNWSYTAIAEYTINTAASAYVKYAQGYRTGGFNGRAIRPDSLRKPVDEETVDSFEIGLKSEWLDSRVRANLAVFTMNYDDLQLSFASATDVSDVNFFNAAEATINGFELDVTAVPFEGLLVSLQYGYLDTNIDEVINPVTGLEDHGRYELPSAPQSTYTADVEYTLPPLAIGTLLVNLNYSWRDDVVTTAPIYQTPYARIDSYGLLNGRITLREIPLFERGELRIALWGKNLTDKEYLVDVVGSFPWSEAVGAFGEPRSYGVDMIYEY